MPQDEELNRNNSDFSDADEENSGKIVRPVTKEMMQERAMRLQGRRDEIRTFLQMNQEKRKNLMAFSEFQCVVFSLFCGSSIFCSQVLDNIHALTTTLERNENLEVKPDTGYRHGKYKVNLSRREKLE